MEKLVKNLNKPEKPKKEPVEDKALEAVYQDLEEKLKQSLGTKVAIASRETVPVNWRSNFIRMMIWKRLQTC